MSGSVLALRDVFLVHRGPESDVVALRGLDLSLEAGEIVCLAGPSGAGKSSALQVAAGLRRPSAGGVSILGTELSRLAEPARAALRQRSLGILRQPASAALSPSLSVADAVELPLALRGTVRAARRARVAELLDAVGLAPRARARPGQLSGGERLRLALAQAIAHRPAVLILDEPTGELDDLSARSVLDLVFDLAREAGMSVLLASHDPAAAALADRLVRLRDGRVAEETVGGSSALVVDARGWVRLPSAARAAARMAARVEAGRVELEPVGPPREPAIMPALGLAPAAGVRLELAGVARRAAVERLDVAFPPGTMTTLAGRSGAGKTTLLRQIAGLDDPPDGSVLVDGVAWSRLDPEARGAWRRERLGFLAQEPLPPEMLTAREALELALELRGDGQSSPDELLAAVGLGAVAARPVERLSQGEVQRLAFVRALAGAGGLLLVDEPTSRLDEPLAERVGWLLRSAVAAGNTVVCATHDPRLLALADARVDLEAASSPVSPSPSPRIASI